MAENPIVNYQDMKSLWRAGYITNDANRGWAQEFVAVADYTIDNVKLRFKGRDYTATTTVNALVSIQGTDENDKPDGNILASDSKSFSIASTDDKWIEFSLSVELTFGQKYHIVVIAYNDDDVMTEIRGDFYYPITDGQRATNDGGITWSAKSSNTRIGFTINGQLVPPVVTTDDAYYGLYNDWEGWESIFWTVTQVQKIISGNRYLGVCYSTENTVPTYEDSMDGDDGYFDNGYELSNYIPFVTPGETYYVRAFCYLKEYPPNTYPNAIGYGEVIEVVIPGGIEVTTNAATEISYEWAMGNGEITSGTNATERGFEIKLNFSGTLYDAIDHSIAGFEGDVNYSLDSDSWVGTLTKTETETGDFAEGEYSLVLGWETVLGNPGAVFSDKLFKCESYTYRAYAVIDGKTYYGEWVEFSTLCDSGDNQQPNDDISDGNPTEPVVPIPPDDPYPPFEWEYPPEIPYPPFPELPPLDDLPDYPPPTFVGDFYYRKPYTKKDLDELRKKCIIYNKNSIEFALVLRHNMNVLREFLNMMTDYLGTDEFNDFTDLVPPQNLKELYLDPIEPEGFRTIINGFINNTVNNNIAVNRNFKLLTDGLSDYETSEDASFRDITSAMKRIDEDNPDVHRMKQIIDDLNYEVAANFGNVMYNLNVVRARLLS